MPSLRMEVRSIVDGTEHVEATCQWHEGGGIVDAGHIAVVYVGDFGNRLVLQGDPEALVALVDRMRSAVVDAVRSATVGV